MIVRRQKEFGNKENKLKRRDWELRRGKNIAKVRNATAEVFGGDTVDVSKMSESDLIRESRSGLFESPNVKNQRGVKKVKGYKDPNVKPINVSEDAFDRALKKMKASAKVANRKAKEEAERRLKEEAARVKREAEEEAARKVKEQEFQALKKAKNIKNAKIAGGVVLGATVVGAGVHAYKKHKDKKNDSKEKV